MEVILSEGTTLAQTIRCPKGHPRDPFTWEEQVTMFRKQAAVVLSDARTDQLVDAVRNLDSIGNLADVGELTFVG